MSVIVTGVVPKSKAYYKRIKPDFELITINGNEINDILDFDFYAADTKLEMIFKTPKNKTKKIIIKKEEYEPLGLEFETFLMDKHKSCRNKCIFCFIDQLPKGMRESLYFKDDDDRLSFLFGNYITLTNLNDSDIDRIIKMNISPVNISVHTTNKELRVKMMNNRFAGEKLDYVYKLANAGITINCQLVLCPGINDGDELKKTLNDLGNLYPAVQNIACVPVGLTDYREGLCQLECYNSQTAKEVVDIIEEFTEEFFNKNGVRLAYAADEFYIKSGYDFKPYEYYGDFNQLENGVGMVSLLKKEAFDAIDRLDKSEKEINISLATGVAASKYLKEITDKIKEKLPGFNCNVYEIKNKFFGENITVAGLLTGRDLTEQLKGKPLGSKLIIPSAMLRKERDLTLDDMTVPQMEEILGIKIEIAESLDGFDLINKLTN